MARLEFTNGFRFLGVLQLESISVPRKGLRVVELMSSLNPETSLLLASSSSKRRSKPLVSLEAQRGGTGGRRYLRRVLSFAPYFRWTVRKGGVSVTLCCCKSLTAICVKSLTKFYDSFL